MEGKFFIIGVFSDINSPFECFRPTDLHFGSTLDCDEWIKLHKKYFAPSVHFGIFSVDNEFYGVNHLVDNDLYEDNH